MSLEDLESGRALPINGRRQLAAPQDHPSRAVVASLFQINTAVASFTRQVNALGTPKDTINLRHKLHESRLHIVQLVKEISAKLKQASEANQHTKVSAAKKIADAKLAKDFQSVLREFQKAQRLAAEREIAYSPFVPEEVLQSHNTVSGDLGASSYRSPEHVSLLVESKRQEVSLVENEIPINEASIEERDEGIREIQQQIGEVNEIFKDLAVLVHEQGTMIDDISSNIQNAHSATSQATFQITEVSKTQKSISSMSCLLLVIFGIVLLILVIVLAA